MPKPPPLGAVSAGIRYQVRFFWRQALAMLSPTPTVSKVILEHRGVNAVDDVVVFYMPPGVNDRGISVKVDFHQIKFHVAQSGSVDHSALLDMSWTGTQQPMLVRLAGAWIKIKTEYESARLSLVTNWPWAPSCPIAPLIRDGGRLDHQFLAKGPRSRVGRVRAKWQGECGLTDAEFEAFVSSLRFSTSAVSQDDAGLWLNDRCQLAGLLPVPIGADHSPYDDLGVRLIESGRTEHTPETLRALVEKEGLVAMKEPPFASTFAVRSFARFAHEPTTDGACVVDLTDLFSDRRAISESVWSDTIRQRLDAALAQVERLNEPLQVALDTHLSISWYVGRLLDSKLGKHVVLRQRIKGKGIELWDMSCSEPPSDAASWNVTKLEDNGSDLALVVSVTHLAVADARRFILQSLPTVGTVIHAELPNLGSQAVHNGAHARWLVDTLTRMLAPTIAELRPARVHLFPACPASIAFLLGQEAQVFGPTTVYEYDFGASSRGYRAGMHSQTEQPQ